MYKNGQLVKCINSSGSIHIAEGNLYRVSHCHKDETTLIGIPGYYHTDAFTPYYESRIDAEVYAAKGKVIFESSEFYIVDFSQYARQQQYEGAYYSYTVVKDKCTKEDK
jgi:hypothetical protein